LIIVYVTVVFCTRELECVLMLLGQLSCEAVNFALKRLVKENRPKRTSLRLFLTLRLSGFTSPFQNLQAELKGFFDVRTEMHGRGYGMPSSHAQFSSFFAVYLFLLLLRRGLGGRELPRWRRGGYALVSVVGSGLVAGSRVYLNYHTLRQVVVGYFAGTVCALGWYAVTGWLRTTELGKEGWVKQFTGGRRLWEVLLWVGGTMWVRDTCLKENLVVEGWRKAQDHAKKR
jgi:dolichyldiphosphatase